MYVRDHLRSERVRIHISRLDEEKEENKVREAHTLSRKKGWVTG